MDRTVTESAFSTPNQPQNHDEYQLNIIYERNKSRVREIEAVLAELTPTIERLMRERRECLVICQRSSPFNVPMAANGESGPQTSKSEMPIRD